MKINAHVPTQQELQSLLAYDKPTGEFRWLGRMSKAVKAGDIAGNVKSDGYRRIKVMGKVQYAHRLAWIYVYGYTPLKELDHIDGDPSNNRIENLREVDRSHNMRNRVVAVNNNTGVTGVSRLKNGKFTARIMVRRKTICLGCHNDFQKAVNARKSAEIEYGFLTRSVIL